MEFNRLKQEQLSSGNLKQYDVSLVAYVEWHSMAVLFCFVLHLLFILILTFNNVLKPILIVSSPPIFFSKAYIRYHTKPAHSNTLNKETILFVERLIMEYVERTKTDKQGLALWSSRLDWWSDACLTHDAFQITTGRSLLQ